MLGLRFSRRKTRDNILALPKWTFDYISDKIENFRMISFLSRCKSLLNLHKEFRIQCPLSSNIILGDESLTPFYSENIHSVSDSFISMSIPAIFIIPTTSSDTNSLLTSCYGQLSAVSLSHSAKSA